jgi:hypothetical protein
MYQENHLNGSSLPPGVVMDAREAVLREAGHEFVKWARAGA